MIIPIIDSKMVVKHLRDPFDYHLMYDLKSQEEDKLKRSNIFKISNIVSLIISLSFLMVILFILSMIYLIIKQLDIIFYSLIFSVILLFLINIFLYFSYYKKLKRFNNNLILFFTYLIKNDDLNLLLKQYKYNGLIYRGYDFIINFDEISQTLNINIPFNANIIDNSTYNVNDLNKLIEIIHLLLAKNKKINQKEVDN